MQAHVERLQESIRSLGLEPVDVKKIAAELEETAREIRTGAVRIAVKRQGPHRILIHAETTDRHAGSGPEGLLLTTAPASWPAGETFIAQVKHSERLSSILARMGARDSVEVLRFGPEGTLTEGTVSNLFLVKMGTVITPPLWSGVLGGVARRWIFRAAGRLEVPVQEIPVTRHDLFNADEAFLTNALAGIRPIRGVDGRRIGLEIPGPITKRFIDEWKKEDRNSG